MRRDPRLHLDPTTRRYHEKVARDEAVLEATVAGPCWIAMLEPLTDAILLRTRGERVTAPAFPPGCDPRFERAFSHIVKRFLQEDDHQREPLEVILERRLAQYLGVCAPGSLLQWDAIASGLHDWKAWITFVDAVPIAVIEAHVSDLARMPTDPTKCLDGFGALRDNFEGVLRTLDGLGQKEPDDWKWLDRVEHFADEARLGADMSLRSELLARAGPLPWLAWATSFPHVVLIASAVNDIDDLDFIEVLIEHCHEVPPRAESRKFAHLLLVRRCVELWERVDRSLARAADDTWRVDVDIAEYQSMRDAWTNTEFPQRSARLAALLVASADGLCAAVVTARHLRPPRPAPQARAAAAVRASFRDRLLDELGQRDVDAMMGQLLALPTFSAGVFAASLLALKTPTVDRFGAALDAYSTWLESTGFFWASPLDGHDREVVDVIASVLAQRPMPVLDAKKVLATAERPLQGWGFDLNAWFEAVPRVAHVLIVIAAAAAGAQSLGNAQVAGGLIDVAWSELDLLLRGSPMSSSNGHVASAVAYVWAYASRVFPRADPRVSRAIGRFDDARLMLSAAENFKLNAGALPPAAQQALGQAFDARLPILERHPHISTEALDALRRQVAELRR
ncbi:MAG: hypothetical protein ACLP1X_24095 [Polyangiaceae bacterium]